MIDFSALGIIERKILEHSVAKLFLISRFYAILKPFNVFPSFDHCIIYTERFILNLKTKSFSSFSQVEIWILTHLLWDGEIIIYRTIAYVIYWPQRIAKRHKLYCQQIYRMMISWISMSIFTQKTNIGYWILLLYFSFTKL